jgi:2-succinyl-5-enolpyruvyl-6-hydroxy-3-cyclohexene-1-carboxylate synthase
MPVRDLEAFASPREATLRVVGNRGASGIDGSVSTAFGAAAAGGGPAAAVIGDLALYHDMNGLIAARRFGIDLTLVVIDNGGGGIFHLLPIRGFDPPFTSHFVTPHGLDFRHAARLYDLECERLEPGAGLDARLAAAVERGGARLVLVPCDAAAAHRRRRAVVAAARRAAGERLASGG